MALSTTEAVSVAPVGATLGEGPVWDVARQCLWFVDIKQHRLHCFDPASGSVTSADAPGQIGWALPAADGRLLCGLQGALHWFDPDAGSFTPWLLVEADLPGNRLNDATCDVHGRVWFGSMSDSERAESGHFYRLAGGRFERAGPGPIAITNGPAVSPDGSRIYFTDTLKRTIVVADLAADGSVGADRPFVAFTGDEGHPDGPSVDSAGNVWTGMFGGWGARCFSPAGEEIARVRFPVANVTKVAFGGPDLMTAYATTATLHLTDKEKAAQPLAGNLFAFKLTIAGAATPIVPQQ